MSTATIPTATDSPEATETDAAIALTPERSKPSVPSSTRSAIA